MATSITDVHIFGTKDVAVAGEAVQLDPVDHPLLALMSIAHSDNVGRLFYGGRDVSSTTQKGLAAGESITIEAGGKAFLLSSISIDGTAADGVDFVGVRDNA